MRTVAEKAIRVGVLGRAEGPVPGYCQLGCGSLAENYAHRLPAGQGGPYTAGNGLGLCGSGTTGCHGQSERARDLSYACGWLLRRGQDPDTTPALIVTALGADWHILDDDGTGLTRLAEPGEITGWDYWPGTFADARAELDRLQPREGTP